jgi:UDP-N-acetylmuramate dehydrogenase
VAGRNQVTRAELDDLAARLVAAGVPVERRVRVAELTTYHVGGPIEVLVRLTAASALPAIAAVYAGSAPLLVLGRGSNLLVADAGFAGLGVVLAGEFERLEVQAGGEAGPGSGRAEAGAAVPLPVLARRAVAAGLRGLEFFVGIPGSVGGAVRMNAGGHGRETADVLVEAEVADLGGDGTPQRRPVAALGLGYRRSNLRPTEIVTAGVFAATPGDPGDGESAIAEIVRWRRDHQPGGSNAGSVFANPPGDSAGRLIDSVGLKGLRVGGAIVSPKHANFFQAESGATADDVHRLVLEVQRRVLEATGVALEPELRMIGFADAPGGTG